MTPDQAQALIRDTLSGIAPDSDPGVLAPEDDLREALELDSLDFLRFVEILSERTSRRIEEDDYPRLATLGSAAEFLVGR